MLTKPLLLVLPLALLAGLSIAPVAGSAPATRASLHAASAASFSDAAGDSGAAADVTDVDVGNDLVAGHIVFWVTVPNRPDNLESPPPGDPGAHGPYDQKARKSSVQTQISKRRGLVGMMTGLVLILTGVLGRHQRSG